MKPPTADAATVEFGTGTGPAIRPPPWGAGRVIPCRPLRPHRTSLACSIEPPANLTPEPHLGTNPSPSNWLSPHKPWVFTVQPAVRLPKHCHQLEQQRDRLPNH